VLSNLFYFQWLTKTIVGLLFLAGVVPLTMFFSREPAVPMIMSIYVTLGIFLLLAVRDPSGTTAWSPSADGQILRMPG
jgi:hypothetical protein